MGSLQSIPNLTARKALGRFRILNPSALIPVPSSSPAPRRSSTALTKNNLAGRGDLILYNACQNRSRNKSGIALSIRKSATSVILSGDYDYSQISKYMLPDFNYKCSHYLVVPHHGGKAGKFVYAASPLNILEDAIISVGPNPYCPRHPHMSNINNLRGSGFSVVRTDLLINDYEILL
jgi:beta-lactamase superfamily II metal-dependent hydrolase